MANVDNKTRAGCISIYHECIDKNLAAKAVEVFKRYRAEGLDRDGCTGGGINKETKDSRDMNPRSQFAYDDEFHIIAKEIESNVMECLVDYYNDNPNMLYSFCGFSLADYNLLPPPETIIPKHFRLQQGQFQYYHPRSKESVGGGYPANHAECMIQKGNRTESDFRVLTWMMTLNDLPATKEQDGYTVFTGQKLAVRPKVGQLVLFSPWVDCEHRGNRVGDVEKIIVTAWVSSDIAQ